MKRKVQKAISGFLLLAIVFMMPLAAHADSTQDFTNSETYLRTSYNNDNYIELSIAGNSLTVRGKLQVEDLTGVMVKCGERDREYVDAASGQEFSVRVALSHNGSLPISVYTQKRGESLYWSYVWDKIYLEKTSGGYRIMPSLVLGQNLSFLQAYVDPDNFRDSSKVSDSVKSLSNQIVGAETDDYAKIFLLHKWVAENIYYDYDAYRGGMDTFYDSADILANRRSVCEGYANLLRDLILAQGIPCMKATTYSLGVSTNGGSFSVRADEVNADRSNHAHVEAWVDGRWVIMDATWDSNNKYENGSYNTDTPNGFYYFDITPEALSFDHKYITRANGQLKMQNGAVTGADTPAEPSDQAFSDVPADAYYAAPVEWAVERGITSGTSATTFSPDSTCTTAQILTFLWRAKGSPEPAGAANAFTDIQESDYFYQAALWARENGLVAGTTFDGDAPCTRYATVTYLWKLAGRPEPEGDNPFTDVPSEAQPVVWAMEQDITAGTSAATFSPSATCTRGQIVTFLYRAYAK